MPDDAGQVARLLRRAPFCQRALSSRLEGARVIFSMRNFPLQRSVYLSLFAGAEEKGLHIFNQELLMFWIDRAQPIMVNQLILRRQPGFPTGLTGLLVDALAERVAEWRRVQCRQVLLTSRAIDGSHIPSPEDVRQIRKFASACSRVN